MDDGGRKIDGFEMNFWCGLREETEKQVVDIQSLPRPSLFNPYLFWDGKHKRWPLLPSFRTL